MKQEHEQVCEQVLKIDNAIKKLELEKQSILQNFVKNEFKHIKRVIYTNPISPDFNKEYEVTTSKPFDTLFVANSLWGPMLYIPCHPVNKNGVTRTNKVETLPFIYLKKKL